MLHYEDIVVGSKASYGRYEVTREEVIEFASKYDPQPFHLDDEAAAQTYFGRLSASGWHTGAMAMRMMVENMKGMFKGRTTVFNQDDVAVMTMVSTGLIRVRNPEAAGD